MNVGRCACLLLMLCALALPTAAGNDQQPDRLIAEQIWGDELVFSLASRKLSEEDQKYFARRIDVTARRIAANAGNLPDSEQDSYITASLNEVVPVLHGELEACAKYGVRPLRELKPHTPGELYLPTEYDWPAVAFLCILAIVICVYYLNRMRRRT